MDGRTEINTVYTKIHRILRPSLSPQRQRSVSLYVQIGRRPQNWKYITYHKAARGGPSHSHRYTHIYIHTFNGLFSGTTQVSQYQKGKTNLDFTEARDSEWQWHQLGHMQVCISLQTDNHASTVAPHYSVFLQAGCPSCRPTNSVKALKAQQ